jgi:hypothetical protein
MLHISTAYTFNDADSDADNTMTLSLGASSDFDTMVTAQDLAATAGYYAGTLGDAPDSSTLAGQAFYKGNTMIATITPEATGGKVSDCLTGSVTISVFYLDAT